MLSKKGMFVHKLCHEFLMNLKFMFLKTVDSHGNHAMIRCKILTSGKIVCEE